jgi:hypothetical protein
METINTTYDYATKFPPVGEEPVGDGQVDYYIELSKLSPQYAAESRVRFSTLDEKSLLETLRMNEPKSVGHLWAMFLRERMELFRTRKQLVALQDGMSSVNESMNDEAKEQDLCSSYEDLLENLNSVLRAHGYTGWFEFTGRRRTMLLEVQRERVVRETTSVEIEVNHGDDPDYDLVYEMASDRETDEWYVQDDNCDERDYTVIHEETID